MGGVLTFKFQGAPSDTVNTRALSTNAWNGPGSIIFPAANDTGLPTGNAGAMVSGSMGGPSVIAGYGMPPSQAPSQGVPMSPFYDERLERERERVSRERLDLQDRQAKADRALAEREFEVREKEREAKLKEEMGGRQRELEAKFTATQQNQTGMKDIVAALAPLVMGFMQQSSEARAAQIRSQEESSRRFMEMMQAQNQQTQMMMLKMNEKGIDPSVTMMMEMMRANSTGNGEMMSRIVDAMGAVSKTSVGMIEAIADLQLGGQPESPILAAVREGVKAMASLSQGATTGARKVVQSQAQLPARNPQPQPQPRPQQAAPAPAQQAKAKPTNGAAGPQVVHEVPGAPAPNLPPATENAPQPSAFDGMVPGLTPERKFTPVEGHVIEQLKAMIEARHEPIEEVGQYFIDALTTTEMREELNQRDGDINTLIGDHLGMWALASEDNRAYLGRLGEIVERLGAELGLFSSDEGGEDSEGDESVEG
jgi:hypothetical protein